MRPVYLLTLPVTALLLVLTTCNAAPYAADIPFQELGIYSVHATVLSVDGLVGVSDVVYLTVRPSPPANDLFASPTILQGRLLQADFCTAGADWEGEPVPPDGLVISGRALVYGSQWWTWTAPASGTLRLQTSRVGLATQLAVFRGAERDSLEVLAVDPPLHQSGYGWYETPSVALQVRQGQSYRVRVTTVEPDSQTCGTLQLALDACALASHEIMDDGRLRFWVATSVSRPWHVEESTNLLDWMPVAGAVSIGSGFLFTEPAPSGPHRFYRFKPAF